ncbi:MAG: cyclophilin-like family protein, partial [Candidatus Fonsibacter sp.]
GDEVYFETPYLAIKLDEKATDLITFGEITYWCEGYSIAIGFGPTASRNNKEIRLVTKTNVFGSFSSSVSILNALRYLKNNKIVLIN